MLREEHGDGSGAARSRVHLASVRLAQADLPGATDLLREALRTLSRLKQTDTLWAAVEGGAALACARGRHEAAARLFAAAIPQRDALWDIIDPHEYGRRARDLAAIRAALGEEAYAARFASGAAIIQDEALDLLREQLG